jgi:DNA-binding Xre family transcriptional regulator
MLSQSNTAARMAAKLAEAMAANSEIKQTDIAKECGVTKQAVQGWIKTGRFDKKHLSTLSRVTGKPLWWWLDADPEASAEALVSSLEDWRLQASSRSQAVIDTLTLLAKKNKLRDEDWLLIEQMVQRFAQK